nr:Ig-like domain-containing protein [Staphylococcus epidermidis]
MIKTTNTTTYTFTNYVDQYQNITGSFDLIARLLRIIRIILWK